MCGEKGVWRMTGLPVRGSPPRVRGKVRRRGQCAVRRGITPACAGKSRSDPRCSLLPRDHPRVCGEKGFFPAVIKSLKGSPPRVRGKVFGAHVIHAVGRITPACAGKSRSDPRCSLLPRDHPRVCGEKGFFPAVIKSLKGSPPRVRGKG